jgi:uncharacterized protein YgiM (DUF1202 family)
MKLRSKIATTGVILLLVISLSINIVSAVNQSSVPGSDQDPIVSKSYVDATFNELSTQMQKLLEQNEALNTKLANHEKTIKALQEEVKALKSGTAVVNPGTTPGGGTGTTQPPANQNPPDTLGTAVVNVAVLNLRAKPTTSSAILGKLLKNETVTLVSKSGDWYKITTSKGKTGYVLGTLVTVK